MSEITRAVIRLGFRLDNIGKKTVEQSLGSDPYLWAGNDVEIQVAALWGANQLRSLASMSFLRFDVMAPVPPSEGPDNPVVSATLAAAEIDNTVTFEQWDAGTHAQGAFLLTRAQTALLTVSGTSATKGYPFVVWGLTTHEPAREITLGVGTLMVVRDRSGGTPPEPALGQTWLDVDMGDARYAPLDLAQKISIPDGWRIRVTEEGAIVAEEEEES